MAQLAVTTGRTNHGPWQPCYLESGSVVELLPADNLPDSSPIKWWAQEASGYPVSAGIRAAMDGYGVGLHADDVRLLDGPDLAEHTS